MYNEFEHICPVGVDRFLLAEKLREKTMLHLNLTFQKQKLQNSFQSHAIEKERLITKIQKVIMEEILELYDKLEKMRKRDKIRLDRYKEKKYSKIITLETFKKAS